MTNPPSEVKCCYACEGAADGYAKYEEDYGCQKKSCPCHTESPVSQCVEKKECTAMANHENRCDCGRPECWEEQLRIRVNFDKNQDREVAYLFIHRIISTTLSTLVKEMEEKMKEIPRTKEDWELEDFEEKARALGFNAGISAAVEVVKKMGV